MKIILLVIAVLSFGILSAQQINPIPDYVFKNQMSVGRNSTTDTAAYMSIGPRFGATKGMMPPMVVDTASFSGSKRNGLLIFSVQKNKFLYWDSVRVQWSDMAGSSGQYITGTVTSGKIPKATSSTVITDSRMSESGLLVSVPRFKADSMLFLPKISTTPTDTGAIRYALADSVVYVWTGSQWIKAGAGGTVTSITAGTGLSGGTITSSGTIAVDTATIATRARVQKGIDSLGAAKQNVLTNPVTGTGTTNYLAKFTGTSAVGNSQIFDDGASIGIGTATPTYKFDIRGTGSMVHSIKSNSGSGQGATYNILQSGGVSSLLLIGDKSGQVGGTPDQSAALRAGTNIPIIFEPNAAEAMRLNTAGEMIVSSDGTDAGAYKFQVQGNIYNTTGAVFAASSGNVGIGTASPSAKLQVDGAITATSGPYPSAVNGIHMHFSNGIGYIQAEQGGTAYRQLSLNGDFLTFVAQGTERMRIKSDGEVLIGTTSDAGFYPLQVSGNIYNTNDAHFSVTGGGVAIGIGSSPSKLWIYGGSLSTSSTGGSGFASRLTTGRTGTFDANTLTSFHNYFDSESIEIASGSSNTYVSGISVTGRSATNYSGTVRFITSSSERMRINPDGELLVNTTTDAGAYALQVSGNQYVSSSFYMNPANSSDNYMLLGTSTVRETSGIVRGVLQVVGRSLNTGGITIAGELTNNAYGNYLQFIKSRSTSNTIVQNGDQLGGVIMSGADGTNYLRGALIHAYVDGTPGTNDMPTRLEFGTTKDGASVPTLWMILNNNGELLLDENPVDAGAYKLQVDGAIYSTSTITTGAPSGGTAKPFKIGAAATVSPTSPNRTIEIEIDGTTYYIHAKTTND